MLSNFKKRIRDHPDASDNATAQTICSQPFETSVPCTRYRSQSEALLPSSRSIIQVLYPPSYLGVPFPFPEPPYPAQEDGETCPSLSTEGVPLSRARPDPLAEDPLLTGVPSQGTPRRRVPVIGHSPPITRHQYDLDEPLPAYSRLDQCRPRFAAASNVLGPYPPLSIIHQSTR